MLHHHFDGRGDRWFYLNGRLVNKRVATADTKKGIITYYPEPLRASLVNSAEAFTKTLRGAIRVIYIA